MSDTRDAGDGCWRADSLWEECPVNLDEVVRELVQRRELHL